MKVMPRLQRLMQPVLGWVALSVLLGVGTVAANIGLLGTSAYLIARAALHPSVAELQVAIVGVRFFGIVRSLLRYAERLSSHSVNFRLLAQLRTWFFTRLEALAPARLVDERSGDLLDRVVADINNLEDFYVRAVAPPITALMVTLGMGLWIGASFLSLGGVLIIGMLTSAAVIPLLAQRWSAAPGAAAVAARADLAAGLTEGLQGLADLQANNANERYFDQLRIASHRVGRAQRHLGRTSAGVNAFNGLIVHLTLWFVLILAVPLVVAGEMEGVTLAVVTLVTLAAFEATLPVSAAAQRLESTFASARRLFALADLPPAVVECPAPLPAPRSAHLRIADLTFTYPHQARPALQAITLDLPAGKRIGIVGPSGSGKSTLLALLLRFWEFNRGQIELDNRDLRAYDTRDVRAFMAVVGQRPTLFRGTLRSNLLIAAPLASEEMLQQAVQQAQLASWVAALPQGFDTPVGERGRLLSGGEGQRLAVARAILKQAPVWLLDEPTVHLDGAMRRSLACALEQVTRDRSLIWVTHHFEEVKAMDEVLVLWDGRIVERGRPADLRSVAAWYSSPS